MRIKSVLRSAQRAVTAPADESPASAGSESMPDGVAPNPPNPEVLGKFRLFAVVKSWMDGDIIEATVRNAFVQGVEQVFVIDNGSEDDTVARAEAAGAVIAEVYHTKQFNPRLAQVLINGVVARESLRCGEQYIWWLHLDSDEFPEGPDGLTVRDYLASLDRRFRIVGADFLNHLPSGKPEYLSGFHPLDFQPLYYAYRPTWTPPCGEATHWKHPLQLFDAEAPFIRCEGGAHHAIGGLPGERAEPDRAIVVHHFQYRDEGVSREKLRRVLDPSASRALPTRPLTSFNVRMRSLDAVYGQRWGEVETTGGLTIADSAIETWAGGEGTRRWYAPAELEAARRASAGIG
jgi:Glycosyl transferase family 2